METPGTHKALDAPHLRALAQLTALANPRRLSVFRLLMRRYPEAVSAGDLALALGLPASSLSAGLSQLRQAGLVTQDRCGTSLLYAADLSGIGGLTEYLIADCCRGRAVTGPQTTQPPAARPDPLVRNVLFVCTGNSARSIMAETILRDWVEAPGCISFRAYSAGTHPRSDLHPEAVALLQSRGHAIGHLRAKHVSEFQRPEAPRMDFVFTVCDLAANEECPPWPGLPITGHWGQPDPARAEGTQAQRQLAFQQTYAGLRNRIAAFAALPLTTLDRARLQVRVDQIAQSQ